MTSRSVGPGLFLVTAICGIVDAACFLELGGVFAEIMTGNLMFLAFSIGQGRMVEELILVLVPLAAFAVGALAGGLVIWKWASPRHARLGFAVTAVLVAAAALLALIWQPSGDSTSSRVVVAVLALGMGLQNALMLSHGHPDVATNVMTLTMVRLLSNWSVIGGTNARWQLRLGSLGVFFAGAMAGAFLLRWGAGASLTAAAVLYAVALVWILKGRPLPAADRA